MNHPRIVQIAATFTAEPLLPSFDFVLRQACLNLEIAFSPYNQIFQELLSDSSSFAANRAGTNLLLLRIADFVRDAEDDVLTTPIIFRTVDEICVALKA